MLRMAMRGGRVAYGLKRVGATVFVAWGGRAYVRVYI